ncbi:HBS1-like protein [Cyanidiococcus yangmingshanensis]|uniref:HBS1-like protein n=1 Tax=Cyanidiococcus yangmingshanensis TaxID=2690220 RepID=A0A7J7IDZ9_9RHOD|nr:HBS1-like protein [Cyanidiococcus yangmingshanensis]
MSGWTREISQALAEYEDELDDENYIEEHADETEDGLGGRSWVYESTSRALPEQTETTAVSLGAHESRCRTSRVGPRSSASPHQARGVKEHPSRTTRTDLNAPCSASLASAPKEHQTVLSGGGSRTATNCQTRNQKALSETVIDSVRRHISVVFCGHVDAGKSTLMAQTLLQLGQVSEQELRRVERDVNQAGKESFRLAWMLDSEEYERAHEVTVDVAIRKASLSDGSFSVSFLDCPGHRDFVTAFLRGAFLADVGVLVVDARPGALESGLSQQGQTLQHARILRHIGLDRLLVAVNKMDICAFDESRFLAIREKLDAALRSGLDWDDIAYIPCSGITGENITHAASDERLRKWYQEPHYRSLSFLDAIQQYQQATCRCTSRTPTRHRPIRRSIGR